MRPRFLLVGMANLSLPMGPVTGPGASLGRAQGQEAESKNMETEKTKPGCGKIDGQQVCKVAIQTNNVEVDDRGYIYIADRAGTGMHILGVTGEAKGLANTP